MKIIYKSLILNTHANNLFTYFTESNKMKRWLCDSAEVEPETLGKYEIFWDNNNKSINNTVGCKIIAYEFGKLLIASWKGPKEFSRFMNSADPLTMVSFHFNKIDENETELTLIHSGWRQTQKWENARVWFEKAWDLALANLNSEIKNPTNNNNW